MRIALVCPNYLDNFFLKSASFYQPLGITMIATVLKHEGHVVNVFDATAERMNIHRLTRRVKAFSPDVVGVTANIAYAWKAILTAKWLKRHLNGVRIIFGGPYATSRHELLLKEKATDIVVFGEGEATVVELINAMDAGKNLRDVAGIAFQEKGEIVVTKPREHIMNLDTLPFPAWDLLPRHGKYFWDPKGKRFFPLVTSRGCPYGCVNCTKIVHGYKVRYRSVGNIIQEIKYLKRMFDVDEIIIIDDCFNYDVSRAEHICEEIMKLDFPLHLRFPHGLRADKITPGLAWKLRMAGAYDIVLGIESGSQEVVYKIGKNLDLRKVEVAVFLLKKMGIMTNGFFMVGLPCETISTLIKTKEFVRKLDLDMALIHRVIPFPGTRLYDIIQRSGTIAPQFEKEFIFYHQKASIHELSTLPAELIELAYQDIHRAFYFNISRIMNMIARIRLKHWRVYLNFTIITMKNVLQSNTRRYNPATMKRTIIQKIKAGKKQSMAPDPAP